MSVEDGATPSRSFRLTISFRGMNMSIVDRRSLVMPAPISDAIRGYEGQSGFWYELHNATGETIYRRVMHNPLSSHVEEHTIEPTVTSRRHPVGERAGTFMLLVPEDAAAASLVLFSSPPDAAAVAQPARKVAEFALGSGDGTG